MKKNILRLILIIVSFMLISNTYAEELTNIFEIEPQTKCVINRDVSNNIRAMQGVYFYDHYAVYIGFQADDAPAVVTLVDLDSCTVIDKNNEVIMGHANDLTYNSRDDKFYVGSQLADKKVYAFRIINNRIVQDENPIQANFRVSGITYDKDHDRYISQNSSGTFYTFKTFDATGDDYKKISTFPYTYDNFADAPNGLVRQGMSYKNNNIYFARTIGDSGSSYQNDSYVLVYDANTGAYKYSMHFPSSYFNGHLEGVTVVGNKIYFGLNVNASVSPNTNQSFLVYDGVDELEQRYNLIIKKTELVKTIDDIKIRLNDKFDYSAIKIKFTHNDNTTDYLELNENNCQIINFDSSIIGKQSVTVRYDGVDYLVDVNIVSDNTVTPDGDSSNKSSGDEINPQTGFYLPVIMVSLLLLFSVIIYFISKRKKIFKI